MPVQPEVVRFGLFEADMVEGVLIKNGRRIKLQEQPFRVLSILLEHPGQTITREQFRQALWPADTFVDFDRGLNAAMAKLRQALGDSADNPRFIETQARRGYRFIAPVTATEAADTTPSTGAAKSGFTIPRVTPLLAGALLLVLLIAAGILYYRERRNQRSAVSNALLRTVPLTTYPGFQWAPTFSPEGTRVAFAWDQAPRRPPNIYVKLIGGSEPVQLTTGNEGDFAPAWSPDGRTIAFLRSRGSLTAAVMLIPSLGGPERELTRLRLDTAVFFEARGWMPAAPLLAWSLDNKWLLAVQQTVQTGAVGVVRISVESGTVTPVELLGDSPSNRAHGNLSLHSGDAGLALSPDGRSLAFAHSADLPNNHLFTVKLSGDALPVGTPRSLDFGPSYCLGVAWTGDGQNLVVSSNRRGSMELWKVPLNPQREPTLLNVSDTGAGEVAVSRTGQRLVFTHYSSNSDIWRADLGDAGLKAVAPFIVSTMGEIRPSYSTDGRRIAFESDRTGNEEVWTLNADGSRPVQLTSFGNSYSGSPRWSPDDGQIAFDSNAAGKWDVYVMPSQGGKPVRFTQGSASSVRPSWSHDGKWIYYCASENSGPQIWKKPAGGGAAIQLTKNGGCSQMESADGAYVYYLSSDNRAVWRVPTAGGEESPVLTLKHKTQFAVGVHGIYFMESIAPVTLKYLEFTTGAIKVLGVFSGTVSLDEGLAVSPDERSILWGATSFAGSQLMLVEGFR